MTQRGGRIRARVTPHYIQLVHDACLKSFWRKKSLSRFLVACGVQENFLATWSPDETKRDLLDRLFATLQKTRNGKQLIVVMARHLIEQDSFPDLANWEDSPVKIRQAKQAVERLRAHQEEQESGFREQEKREAAQAKHREYQAQLAQSRSTLQKLSERFDALSASLGTQEAGYAFQDWFYDLADFFEVRNKRPYWASGRQIDGSVTVSGTTYLVELKFTSGPAGSTDIDIFRNKVTSKADNTMGVMLSISGYTSGAIETASGRRTPLLLFDHSHVLMMLRTEMTLKEVIDRVRRHASQTGEAYLAAGEFGR